MRERRCRPDALLFASIVGGLVRLLVSVSDALEVPAALAGGADIIDAKDPSNGALGAVSAATLLQIGAAVARQRTFSAAAGDAASEDELAHRVREFGASGVDWIKIGFAGVSSEARLRRLIAAALQASGSAKIVTVAYADAAQDSTIGAATLMKTAAETGAAGVLLDTMNKQGPGLCTLVPISVLATWVDECHSSGMLAALAGKLTSADLPHLSAIGADIAGVRGAACVQGRTGYASAEKVRELRMLCRGEASLAQSLTIEAGSQY